MAGNPKKPLHERIAHAEELASQLLADGNESAEAGQHEKVEKCFGRS